VITKKFYRIPIVGSGTEEDPYRPAFLQEQIITPDGERICKNIAGVKAWVAIIPSDPQTGSPLFPYTLVKVKATEERHKEIREKLGIERALLEKEAEIIGKKLDKNFKLENFDIW